ncbi:MAG: nicotinate-nucleotide adenylyltransferase [Pseudomonadota bacterium]
MRQSQTSMRRRRAIGLLGGSFNPAHAGHRFISLYALRRLKVDEVWWVVSPQNPLKSSDGMAPFDKRFTRAAAVARHPRIRVTDIETRLGTRYTADTLRQLTGRFPRARFIWLMGADNLRQMHRWEDWDDIFRLVRIAVFDRPQYSTDALLSPAARRYSRFRLPSSAGYGLIARNPPAWVFLRTPLHPISATRIRAAAARPG